MPASTILDEIHKTSIYLSKWLLIIALIALPVGSLVAFFLWMLDILTTFRETHIWIIYFLPCIGIVIYALYKYAGKNAEAGNNLIINEIHHPDAGVPLRMAPLVLFTTLLTHLFGGSAGREGTAVQIGGSIAHKIGCALRCNQTEISTILQCGIAAGFGAVFGTPVAGAVFALEILIRGKINYTSLLPCLLASVFADFVCNAWGTGHIHYHIRFADQAHFMGHYLHFDSILLVKTALAGFGFGVASVLFSETSHLIRLTAKTYIKTNWLTPFIGGLIVLAITALLGTYDYLGIGVHPSPGGHVSISTAFHTNGATYFSWLWKLILTAITLGMGFKGGEVTPLFFIGATLGNTMAMIGDAPADLMAGLGFIAVFAAATNTPLASTIMGIELFGGEYTLYFALVCFIAYHISGHTGIYGSQRVYHPENDSHATLEAIFEKKLKKLKTRLL